MSTVAGKVRMTLKGAWNSASAYEILDVVMSADGVSAYMAKKDVPAGTALTNTEYWDAFLSVDDAVAAANAATSAANNAATNANTAADEARAATAELSNETVSIIDKVTSPFTANGSIIQCHPVEDYPLDVSVNLEPVQEGEGDPYPAGGGKNKIVRIAETQTVNGITFTINPDESVTVNGTATATIFLNYGKVALTANTQYKLTSGISYPGVSVKFVNANVIADAGAINYTPTADDNDETIAVRVASGAVVTNLIVYPMVRIASDADGAYAPSSNIRPISGHTEVEVTRCGKNLCDPSRFVPVYNETIQVDGDDIIIKAGSQLYGIWMNYPGFFEIGQSYMFSVQGLKNHSTDYWGARVKYTDGTYANQINNLPWVCKIEKPVSSFTFYIGAGYTSTEDVVISGLQFELGSTATTYEPYQGDSYTVTLPETVYGGTVDVSGGKTDETWVVATLDGSESLYMAPDWKAGTVQLTGVLNNAIPVSGYTTKADIICSHFKVETPSDLSNGLKVNGVGQGNNYTLYIRIGAEYNTADLIKDYLAAQYAAGTPVQVAYKLNTPNTIATTAHTIPALDGINTVYSDVGDVTVNGRIDPRWITDLVLSDDVEDVADINNWKDVGALVKSGRVERRISVGDQLTCAWNDEKVTDGKLDCPMDVVHFQDVELSSGLTAPAMILQSHYANKYAIMFDAQEALYDCTTELAAGTYNFLVKNNPWNSSENDKYIQFTLSNPVPAGGQIVLSGAFTNTTSTVAGNSVYTCSGNTSYTKIETATLSEGQEGTYLGQSDASGNVNDFGRAVAGYNRWSKSALRQYLNSSGYNWWKSQNKWDRAPSNAATYPGYMSGFDPEFLAEIQPIKVVTAANTKTDGGVYDTTYDKFFLPSKEQLCWTPQISDVEGETWEYYAQLAAENGLTKWADWQTYPDMIKYAINSTSTTRTCFVRSAHRGNSHTVWYVGASGTLGTTGACGGFYAAPACAIVRNP